MQNHRQRFKAAILIAVFIFAQFFGGGSATASRSGVEKKDNPFTVGITFKLSGIPQVCSGALLTPTILVTAAHCMYGESGQTGTDYFFTKPGVELDAAIDPTKKYPKITKVYSPPGFVVDPSNQRNDIAFVQLDIPLATSGFIALATSDDLAQLSQSVNIHGYGFGYVYETNTPYSNYPHQYSLNWESTYTTPVTTAEIHSTTATACSGDSGGPITGIFPNGKELLFAVMSGASNVINHCGTPGVDGKFTMQVTVIDSFKYLIPTPIPTPTPTPTLKKMYKITCVKGKVKKYLTAANPRCPSGYKQTAKVLVKK